jgi:putative methionine-R-sulfoxide reductase with GAF domain
VCDPKVKSEACLPIVRDGRVVGVIDAEHSTAGYFINRRVAWLAALAVHLPGVLPPSGITVE